MNAMILVATLIAKLMKQKCFLIPHVRKILVQNKSYLKGSFAYLWW